MKYKIFTKKLIMLLISTGLLITIFIAIIASLNYTYNKITPHKSSEKIFQKCPNTATKERCYEREFKILTENTSMQFAKQTLSSLQRIDPQGSNGCHLISHAISIAETKKNPENWITIFREQDVDQCSGGFIHGVLEAHMSEDPTFVLNPEQFKKICTQTKNQSRGRLSCNHNLGHLLLVQEEHNLQQAVNICNQITDYHERYECLSGMFMENITRLNLEAHGIAQTIPWDTQTTREVENICKTFSDLPAQACWKVISYMYAALYNNNPVEVFNACNKTPTKKTAEECYIYGAGNMVTFQNFDQRRLKDMCTVYDYDNPLYERCMFQVMAGLMGSTLAFSDRVVALCENAPEDFQKRCFSQMGSNLSNQNVTEEDKKYACQKVPGQFQNLCLNQKG